MKIMNNKVYNINDFKGITSSMIVDDCWWLIDSVSATKVGEYSKVPLFEVQLKPFESVSKLMVPEGYTNGSVDMIRNRTFFVREGRPMFNIFSDIWRDTEDIDAIRDYVSTEMATRLYAGHVERLSGINYTRTSRMGSLIASSKLEVWYPETFEQGAVIDDFIYLCNKGVYTPIIEDKSPVDANILSGVDPKIIEAILAMKK